MQAPAILQRLLALAERLQRDNADFVDQPQDQQRWYDRGYGNGILLALEALGYADELAARGLAADDADMIAQWSVMDWGKAYAHGQELGEKEAREVLVPRQRLD